MQVQPGVDVGQRQCGWVGELKSVRQRTVPQTVRHGRPNRPRQGRVHAARAVASVTLGTQSRMLWQKYGIQRERQRYHCFCESPWTGAACDKTAHASMVVNSLVIVAIVTFVMGLCCIPLAKEYWQQREQQRYKDIIKGDSDLRDQIAILRSSN